MTRLSGFLRFRLGVREKLLLILLIALLASLAASGILSLRSQEKGVLDEVDRHGAETAEIIGNYLANNVVSRDYHAIDLVLQDITRGHDIVYARMDNSRGIVMAEAGTLPGNSSQFRQYSKEIRLNGEGLGRLTLSLSTERVANSLASHQREAMAWQTGSVLLIMVCGFAALSFLIARPLTIIVGSLRKSLKDAKSVPEPITLDTADEFGDLARGFNALGAHLNTAQKQMETHVAAANRELQDVYGQLVSQTEALRTRNEELEQLSLTDPLTGLYNRRYFERLMENEVSHAVQNDETISILFIDVDRFKSINMRLGHNGGDEIIRGVSRAVTGAIRKIDVACRYGNDEFIVLCRRATIAIALSIADDLLQGLADSPALAGDGETRVTASIGIATIPGVHNITSAADFFQCANEALHHCKRSGQGIALHYSMIERNIRLASLR